MGTTRCFGALTSERRTSLEGREFQFAGWDGRSRRLNVVVCRKGHSLWLSPTSTDCLKSAMASRSIGKSVAIRMAGPRCSSTEDQAAHGIRSSRNSGVAVAKLLAPTSTRSLAVGLGFEPLRLCNPGSPICKPSDPSLSDSSPIRLRLRADRHPRIARRQPRTKGLRRFEGRERVESEPSAPPCFLGSATER